MKKPLGIAIDARCVRAGASGVGHYVAGLLRGIDTVLSAPDAPNIRVHAIRLRSESAAFAELWSSLRHVQPVDVDADYQSHPAGDIFLQLRIGSFIRSLKAKVLVSPFFHAPMGPRRFARVIGILDDLPWSEPRNYPASFRWYVRTQTALSLPFAEVPFTLTKATARGLRRHLRPWLKERPERVPGAVDHAVFRPAANAAERDALQRRLGDFSPMPLAVFVASFEPRKNHATIVRALRPLAGRIQLALIGRSTESQRRILTALAGELRIRFVETNGLAEVADWTRAADLVLFPSRNEGFGLPALEALACGVPLIASDIPALREVAGPCAIYAPPGDPPAWTRAVEGVLAAPPTPGQLAAGRARASRFTWEKSARALLALATKAGS